MKTTQTKQINGQTPGPLYVTLHRSCHSIRAQDNGEVFDVANTGLLNVPHDIDEANARLLASSYTSFDRAGRALGIDASELAESVDLAGLIEALRASEETLANLYRTGVIKTASNLSEDAKTIAVQDLLESLDAARAQLDKLPKGNT